MYFPVYSECFQGVVRFSLLRLGFSGKSVLKSRLSCLCAAFFVDAGSISRYNNTQNNHNVGARGHPIDGQKELGLHFLQEAAASGDYHSIKELYEIYHTAGPFFNEEKASYWLALLASINPQ